MNEGQTKGCLYLIGLILIVGLLFVGYKIVAVVVGPLRVEFAQPNNTVVITQPPNFNQIINTKIPPLASDTPLPQPSITAFAMPTSTEKPLLDTMPDTILEIGQTWRQGGLELTMTKSGWGQGWADEGGGLYSFSLTNLEPNDRSFRLSSDNFSAIDNLGNVVPMIPKQNTSINEYCPTNTVQLPANQTIDLVYKLKCNQNGLSAFALTPRIDAGNTSITEIIISVSFSSISNARWQIGVFH